MDLPTHPNGAAQLDLSAAIDEVYAGRARSAKLPCRFLLNDGLNANQGRVRMRSDHLSSVMPAQRRPAALCGGDPVFAGFLRRFCKQDGDGRDKPGHDSELLQIYRNALIEILKETCH